MSSTYTNQKNPFSRCMNKHSQLETFSEPYFNRIFLDGRRLEVVTDGAQLALDATMVSSLPHTGVQRKRMGQCCAQLDTGRNARVLNSPGVSGGHV